MHIERDLIISILRLTKNGPVSHEIINKDSKIPSQVARKLLEKLQNDGLIYLKKNIVEVDTSQRLKLAVNAINLCTDIENVSSLLSWQEFENMAAIALRRNGYSVDKNLRFRHAGRRWEIDLVGCKKPVAMCIDCKHWHHGMYPAALKNVVEEQVSRTMALAESLPNLSDKLECASWNNVKLIPAVLSLVVGRFKFYDDVPIVPVLQLQDFLSQLPAYTDSLKHFSKRLANQFNSRA